MPFVGRPQQQRGRIDCAARHHDHAAGVDLRRAVAHDVHSGDLAPRNTGLEARHVGGGQECHVGMHAAPARRSTTSASALACTDAGEAIAGIAADAAAGLWIAARRASPPAACETDGLPSTHEIVVQLLDAGLVADGRERVGRARPRLRRIDAALAVHLVDALRLGVVRLEIVVARSATPARRRPSCRSSPKSSLAQAEQRRAVKFGLPPRRARRARRRTGRSRPGGSARPSARRAAGEPAGPARTPRRRWPATASRSGPRAAPAPAPGRRWCAAAGRPAGAGDCGGRAPGRSRRRAPRAAARPPARTPAVRRGRCATTAPAAPAAGTASCTRSAGPGGRRARCGAVTGRAGTAPRGPGTARRST